MKSALKAKMRRLPIVAIDGPAGAGKTTTAREVARRLNFLHLDTGAMYRAIALKALRANCPLDKQREIARIADQANVSLHFGSGNQRILLDDEDVSDYLRLPEVTKAVTPICEVPEVRARMVQMQRKLGERGGVVAEGRDIGTVVFPDADLKIFLVADLAQRARRRLKEMEAAGLTANLEDLIQELENRDLRDQQRIHSPLKQAPDAIQIDTTHLTFEDQVERILQHFALVESLLVHAP